MTLAVGGAAFDKYPRKTIKVVVGMDPSLTGFGISTGGRTQVFSTGVMSEDLLGNLRLRSIKLAINVLEFCQTALSDWADAKEMWFFIEAPAVGGRFEGSHLFEVGWIMRDIDLVADTLRDRLSVITCLVPVGTWKKAIYGKGNVSANELPKLCLKKYGVEFERDRENNQLVAWSLCKYGLGVLAHEIQHSEPSRRGPGARRERAKSARSNMEIDVG